MFFKVQSLFKAESKKIIVRKIISAHGVHVVLGIP